MKMNMRHHAESPEEIQDIDDNQKKARIVIGLMVFSICLFSFSFNSQTSAPKVKSTLTKLTASHQRDCRSFVRSQLQFPSSVDFDLLPSWEGSHGQIKLQINFEAKNGLGNMLPYQAVCTQKDSRSIMEGTIYKR